ncbi:MAG: metallophosphoesterase [Acidobacteriia bacterium]|nr:metallophosphoesterase [Terriglobia bacterium]
MTRSLVVLVFFLIFLASQLYWFRRIAEWGERLIANRELRRALAGAGAIIYILLFAYQLAWLRHSGTATRLTWEAAVLQAPFELWSVGSLLGFGLAVILWVADRLARLGVRSFEQAQRWRQIPASNDPPRLDSASRRRFLEQTAKVVSATPFVVSAYGCFYGRLDVETTRQRVQLPRLPKAFHGFRIAQLSDIHIGPFMSAKEVRSCVSMTNALRPDLVVLTGDFITWDSGTQEDVVEALAGLQSPFGVFGCLGNHERWADVEGSITEMFGSRGIRMLRRQAVALRTSGETLNLMGVDFESRERYGAFTRFTVRRYLEGVERLMLPGTTNILLSHNPNTFDRAAELGIDLSLAGHTHGGQVTLEFIHPDLSPGRLVTSYVRGWFHQGASQLYVNRGIGTIIVPIRLGAPPEITLFELVREG